MMTDISQSQSRSPEELQTKQRIKPLGDLQSLEQLGASSADAESVHALLSSNKSVGGFGDDAILQRYFR